MAQVGPNQAITVSHCKLSFPRSDDHSDRAPQAVTHQLAAVHAGCFEKVDDRGSLALDRVVDIVRPIA